MPAARSFNELLFWQRARQWSKEIFTLTQNKPFARDQRLVVQINDSSESVMANMAEGFGRGTQEEFITFLGYALGSLDETKSHLCAAFDRQYLTKDEFSRLWSEGTAIRKLTVGFIQSLVMPRGGVKRIQKRESWTNKVWEIYERNTGKERPALFRVPEEERPAPRNDGPPE
jgi:four helix bundle protein